MIDNRGRSPGAPGTASASGPQARSGAERPAHRDDPAARGREALDDMRQQARSLGHEAKEEGKAALSHRKDDAADEVGATAGALRSAADELRNRDRSQAGRFVAYAAEQLESVGQRMRDKDIDTLIDDAARIGRRSPAAFFAGSVAVGFLLSRFLKSSQASSRGQEEADTEEGSERAASYADPGASRQPVQAVAAYGAGSRSPTAGVAPGAPTVRPDPGSSAMLPGRGPADVGVAPDTKQGRIE